MLGPEDAFRLRKELMVKSLLPPVNLMSIAHIDGSYWVFSNKSPSVSEPFNNNH